MRGRLLAEFLLKILRSFEQVAMHIIVRSAFAQVGIRYNIVDRENTSNRVSYVDPAIARAVVARFGVIPLPAEHPVEPAAP